MDLPLSLPHLPPLPDSPLLYFQMAKKKRSTAANAQGQAVPASLPAYAGPTAEELAEIERMQEEEDAALLRQMEEEEKLVLQQAAETKTAREGGGGEDYGGRKKSSKDRFKDREVSPVSLLVRPEALACRTRSESGMQPGTGSTLGRTSFISGCSLSSLPLSMSRAGCAAACGELVATSSPSPACGCVADVSVRPTSTLQARRQAAMESALPPRDEAQEARMQREVDLERVSIAATSKELGLDVHEVRPLTTCSRASTKPSRV